MRTPVDLRLREEAARFALRFACEDCVHFDGERSACVHGYPSEAHRRARLEGPEVVFCKEFEVGLAAMDPGDEGP